MKIQIDNTDMCWALSLSDQTPFIDAAHWAESSFPSNKCMASVSSFCLLVFWGIIAVQSLGSSEKPRRGHIRIGERPVSSGSLESSVSVWGSGVTIRGTAGTL